MNTIKFNKKDTMIIAHRGLSGLEPENAIPHLLLQEIEAILVLRQISM